MTTYVTRTNGLYGSLALNKEAQVARILGPKGILPISFYYYNADSEDAGVLSARLDGILASLSYGDDLIVQLPTFMGDRFNQQLVQKFNVFRNASSSKLIFFIHDDLLSDARMTKDSDLIKFIDSADVLIVNSPVTAQHLAELGVGRHQYAFFNIFDFPTKAYAAIAPQFSAKINIIGADSQEIAGFTKAGFKVDAYGPNISANESVIAHQIGLSDPNLPYEIGQNGGWGVIMPTGQDHLYRTNYDLGIMLGAGLPLVVNAGSPDAYWVERYKLGFVSRSLSEAVQQISNCTEQDYLNLRKATLGLATLVGRGAFTIHAVDQAVSK